MTFGFGIVGCGMISHFHAKAIGDIKGATLIGCYNKSLCKAELFSEEHRCRLYPSLKEMLNDPKIDAVCICTPSGLHKESAVLAAKARKHVVVEKPLEITLGRCDAIIDACQKNRVKLTTIMPSRFSPANIALKEAIDSRRFGRLTLGDTYVKWWRSQEYYDSGGWRGTWKLDGGGAYMNQAIHNVDLLYSLMGDVVEVSAITDTLAHKRIEVEDVGVAVLRFKNGALGTIEATTSAFPGLLKKTEIHGTEGSAIVEQDDILLWDFAKSTKKDARIRKKFARKVGGGGGASDPKAISHTGHREQLKDFIRSVEKGTRPLVDGREGRKSVEIILAIYKSSQSGKRIELPLKRDPRLAK